jgi:inosose dehydratase
MRVSINATGWGRHAKGLGQDLSLDTFLREAKAAGYDGVEIGGPGDFGGVAQCRERMKREGLEIAATFASVTLNPWQPNVEEYTKALHASAELGVRTVCVCGGFPWTGRRTMYAQDYDLFAESFRPAAALAGKLGLELAFHPHRGSIVETGRETAELLARLPTLKLCIDTAHLEACGDDALAFVRSFSDRIIYAHIKDYSWKDNAFTELGRGDSKLDVAACVNLMRQRGYDRWLTVELDGNWTKGMPTALESAKMSRQYLREKCGV